MLALGWGFDEAFQRVPLQDVIRALDLTIDRARRRNPSCQIVLITPPPLVDEKSVSQLYADAIRALAREHHAPLINLHAKMIAEDNWETLYSFERDPAVFGLYPSQAGQAMIRAWIAEALQ